MKVCSDAAGDSFFPSARLTLHRDHHHHPHLSAPCTRSRGTGSAHGPSVDSEHNRMWYKSRVSLLNPRSHPNTFTPFCVFTPPPSFQDLCACGFYQCFLQELSSTQDSQPGETHQHHHHRCCDTYASLQLAYENINIQRDSQRRGGRKHSGALLRKVEKKR